MSQLEYAGAKWWKFDFHTHTPASNDFKDKDEVEPEAWLKAFMEKEIDCVAITDHNSGRWIDCLKQKLEELADIQPDWYRPLYLFPGVEISVNGDVHTLAIFAREKGGSDIDQLLGAVGYSGTKGKSDSVTSRSITEVIDAIVEQGGVPIPAHADGLKGLFSMHGLTLQQALDNPNVYAIELFDDNYQKPQMYTDKKVQWTEVKGSDTHSLKGDAIGTFTWIKMDEPSIEGLALALIDGIPSVNRDMGANPNRPPEYFIDELNVCEAKYIGRSEPLRCRFSPFLNGIIGGRGSGKSTLLEFMRLGLGRKEDIPKQLKKDRDPYFNVGGDNLLIENSEISLIYRKGEARYRLNWSAEANGCFSLEEEKDIGWVPCPGEIKSLFPVYIYSQKQIFELAKEPRALINIIDEAPEVDSLKIRAQERELVKQYKQIAEEQLELNKKIADENRLRGEFNDFARQIEQIEQSGHEAILQNYGKRREQLNEIDSLESKWQEMSLRLAETRDNIAPADVDEQHFSDHTEIQSSLETANEKWRVICDKLSELVSEAASVITQWHAEKDKADWMQTLKSDLEQYESLSAAFKQQGIDPDRYPQLLTQQKSIQTELDQISKHQSRLEELKPKKREEFQRIEEKKRELSRKRQKFLTDVLQNNPSVSIEVKLFGEDWDGVEKDIRRILQCENRFDKDVEALKEIYEKNDDQWIEKIKERIKNIRSGKENARDARFANHLQELMQESMYNFELWFPGDDLKVTFGPKNQRIEQGSPGQQSAALLTFILSYGDEPLLLDQPEDDLDNELIYKLIVEQLRETKSQRQVIVVTHNANIVVNGDAEMVLPLKFESGETHLQRNASIQEKTIRQAICDILEGGQQAFEQRYKRVHLRD